MNSLDTIGTVTPILMDWDDADDSTPVLFEKCSHGGPESDRAGLRVDRDGFAGITDGSDEEEMLEFATGLANQATTRRVLAAALLDSELRRRLLALRVAADRSFRESAPDSATVQALYDSLLTLTWETAHGLLAAGGRPRTMWPNTASS